MQGPGSSGQAICGIDEHRPDESDSQSCGMYSSLVDIGFLRAGDFLAFK